MTQILCEENKDIIRMAIHDLLTDEIVNSIYKPIEISTQNIEIICESTVSKIAELKVKIFDTPLTALGLISTSNKFPINWDNLDLSSSMFY
jgi:hypothetical protein